MFRKVLNSIIVLFFLTSAVNADGLENVLNKVYDKGSKSAENFITNLIPEGLGDSEVSVNTKQDNKPTGSIMIVRPLDIQDDDVFFYQAQFNNFYIDGSRRNSINYGLGKRFLSDDDSFYYGLNSFFDLDSKYNKRVSVGGEFKASTFEVNGNYYFGFGGGNHVRQNTERVLDGHELSISGQVPYTPWANISLNNYKWIANKNSDHSQGNKISGEIYLTNDLTFEVGSDDNNINNDESYFAKIIYIPNGKERPVITDGHSSKAFLNSDVREDMLKKVERSNIITIELESSGVVITNNN